MMYTTSKFAENVCRQVFKNPTQYALKKLLCPVFKISSKFTCWYDHSQYALFIQSELFQSSSIYTVYLYIFRCWHLFGFRKIAHSAQKNWSQRLAANLGETLEISLKSDPGLSSKDPLTTWQETVVKQVNSELWNSVSSNKRFCVLIPCLWPSRRILTLKIFKNYTALNV